MNGVVHVNTVLEDEALVPRVGRRRQPGPDHRAVGPRRDLAHPAGPRFPRTVYGLPREATARERMEKQTEWFGAHRDDRPAN